MEASVNDFCHAGSTSADVRVMPTNVALVRWYVANLAKPVYRNIILVRRCVMLLQLARRQAPVLPRSRLLVPVETDDRRFHARIRSNVLRATKTVQSENGMKNWQKHLESVGRNARKWRRVPKPSGATS